MKNKNKQKAILLLLVGWLVIALASLSILFYETHIHQQQSIPRLNAQARAYMKERSAFDQDQSQKMKSIVKQQQILTQEWQQTMKEMSGMKKAIQMNMVANQTQVGSDAAMDMPVMTTEIQEYNPKPLSPQR